MAELKKAIKSALPEPILTRLRVSKRRSALALRRGIESSGYVIARKSDYYSPLPSEFELRETFTRWNKPSSLIGVQYDVNAMKLQLSQLISSYFEEFVELPPFSQLQERGYGPGYTHVDAFVLYAMLRHLKPARYLEVGSGLSTYYCSLAAKRNAEEGSQTEITCIEPFPYDALYQIDGIEIIASLVQDVSIDLFETLGNNDVLFIDSSHVLRIDGDVPFLFLEVMPRLAEGVHVHVHDIPFPYNIPFPADYWVTMDGPNRPLAAGNWPVYWNEAMMLQAFLAFNSHFEIELSCPIIRYSDEKFLLDNLPIARRLADEPNSYSAIWLKRVRK